MKKGFITKLGIIFSFIFSFLLCIFPSINVKALSDGDNYQTEVLISSFTKKDDETIQFTTVDKYNIMALTYVYTYYSGNNVLVENLEQRSTDFNKINEYTYEFHVSKDWQGVKLYKIQYYFNSTTWTDKFTKGVSEWGNMDSKYKMNYIEINDVKLVSEKYGSAPVSGYTLYHNKLYFKFSDLVPETVTKVVAEYDKYVANKALWGIKWNNKYENVVYEVNSEITPSPSQMIKDFFGSNYKKYEIFKSDDSNYDWYIFLQDTYENKSWLGSLTKMDSRKEVIENASIIKISYITEGHYYEDVPVLSPDTGWIYYQETVETKNGNPPWWVYLLIILAIALPVIGILAMLFKPFAKGISVVCKVIWYVLKWTIFLPITLLIRHKKKKEEDIF